jgi:ABC-2 type transport system permease protein
VTRLLAAWGVDVAQWRVLVRTFLKIDFGFITAGFQKGQKRQAMGKWGLLIAAVIYMLTGLMPAAVAFLAADPLIAATLLTSVLMFMLVTTLLTGEGNAIVSANDHLVLGFRPVTSRTYFAVRVTTILVRTIAITTFISILPVLAFVFAKGPGAAAGVLLAAYTSAIAITFGVVAMYGWMLRVAGPTRIVRWVTYLQFSTQFLVFGGFFGASAIMEKGLLKGAGFTGSLFAWVYPGAWFGSMVHLGMGHFALNTVVPSLLGLGLLAALTRSLGGRLSLGYAGTLNDLSSRATVHVERRAPRWLGLLNHETRAIAILVRAQLRNDIKFRLGVISLLPITLMYMYMGMSSSRNASDPFAGNTDFGDSFGLVQVALFFLPMTLRRSLTSSDSYRASWIFHVTPSNRANIAASAQHLIMLFFLLPYLVFLAAVFSYQFHHVPHGIMHAVALGALSYLILQLMVMISPQLPFSMPVNKDQQSVTMIVASILAMMVGMGTYALLILVVYKSALRMALAGIVFAVLAYAFDRGIRRRVMRRPIEEVFVD